jgi:hypothetical protein
VLPTQLNIKTTSSLKVVYKTVEETRLALKERGNVPMILWVLAARASGLRSRQRRAGDRGFFGHPCITRPS